MDECKERKGGRAVGGDIKCMSGKRACGGEFNFIGPTIGRANEGHRF